MGEYKISTGFLFSRPSFLSGAGSVINLRGNYFKYNVSKTARKADRIAFENDFRVVGNDIRGAYKAIAVKEK
jgi:hypothetical protein